MNKRNWISYFPFADSKDSKRRGDKRTGVEGIPGSPLSTITGKSEQPSWKTQGVIFLAQMEEVGYFSVSAHSMRLLFFTYLLIFLSCCSTDITSIEEREDGVTYYKGTNKLVEGTVIRRFENGSVAEKMTYQSGREVGSWSTYDYQGKDFTHGIFLLLNESIIATQPFFSLSKAQFSINTEGEYTYASLSLPMLSFDPSLADLLALRTAIYTNYKDDHHFRDVSIHLGNKEYRFEKEVYPKDVLTTDTIEANDRLIIHVR